MQKIPKCHRITSHSTRGHGGFLGLREVKKQAWEDSVAWMVSVGLEAVPSSVVEEAIKKCLLQASAPGATSPEGCAVPQSTTATLLLPQQFVSCLACTGWLKPRRGDHCFHSIFHLPVAEKASSRAWIFEGWTVCSAERQELQVLWL